jgi:LPXTG-motif cell wall-anchored protein
MLKRMAVLAVALIGLMAAPAAAQQYPPGDNLVTVSDTTPCPGGPVTITAQTFAAGSTVEIALDGTPIASATAGDDGTVSVDVVVPETTQLGAHTITATGPGEDQAPMELTASIDVVACDTQAPTTTAPATGGGAGGGGGDDLPRTGSDTTMTLVRIGLALAALGGVLLAVATKRRRRAAHAAPAA